MEAFTSRGNLIVDPWGNVVATCNGVPRNGEEDECSAEDVAESMRDMLNLGISTAVYADTLPEDEVFGKITKAQ